MADEKHYDSDGHVLVYNPETEGRWACSEEYLEIAFKRGWELAEPVEEEIPDAEPTKPARARKPKSNPGD